VGELSGLVDKQYKIPVSVLVLIHTADLRVLLLERADRPGYWQSVTGSQDAGETLVATARREVREETGIETDSHMLVDWHKQSEFEIFKHWRHRYAPGVTHNTEHVFSLQLPDIIVPVLAPREHLQFAWLPWREAADKVFSWSNADAIRELPRRLGVATK
jgi:dihydroneopterin triphosphate diphosphatase